MGRTIPAGSSVRVRLDAARAYRVGEIVAFVVHDGLCVHRIAYLGEGARTRGFLVTQGDACSNPDAPIKYQHILGPVVAFRADGDWRAVGHPALGERCTSSWARFLLKLVARLLELDVRLATGAAKALRLRKESPETATSGG
jgi:hypothetical protein